METGEGDGTYVAAGVTVVRRKDRQSAERWVGGGEVGSCACYCAVAVVAVAGGAVEEGVEVPPGVEEGCRCW